MSVVIDGTSGLTFPDSSTQASAGLTEGYTAKAWFNLNGSGTIALRGSGNISSATDNGTGQYTMNYSTAMTDTGYSVSGAVNQVGNGSDGADLVIAGYPTATTYTTSATRVGCTWATVGFYESTGMYVTGSVHR